MTRNPTIGSLMSNMQTNRYHGFNTPGSQTNMFPQLENMMTYNPYYHQQQHQEIQSEPIILNETVKENFTAEEKMPEPVVIETYKAKDEIVILKNWWVLVLIIVSAFYWFKLLEGLWSSSISFSNNRLDFMKKIILCILPSLVLFIFMLILHVPILKVYDEMSD